MTRIQAFLRFLYDFVVGDDWRVAVAVIVALALTALIGHAGWFVLPLVVAAVLSFSVFEVARARR
ncbi:hypothetical protein [Conexibacter sp. DBS9H8]|uniref:hypothetical protein n=1 Tax=Conexibacter sp. DBS9H8 TaxID=2937801 RepID=UPI00200BE65A|nr:hypothetical protein [Conexibacter sp. DBS9H8]